MPELVLSSRVPLDDTSRIGEARRMALSAGARAGLGDGELSNLGIVVTEIATNAVRYATGGQLILRTLELTGRSGIELLCIDRGPGMANVAECLRDGFSTRGTMGTGLGAVSRIAQNFEVFSTVESGTVVLARLFAPGDRGENAAPLIATICLPVEGERECGDGWATSLVGSRAVLLLVDGLGHGISAAEAAREAIRIFSDHPGQPAGEILDLIHRGLRSSRGAAAAITEIDLARRSVRFAGLGNIAGWVVAGQAMRAMVSHNGIVGHQARRIQEFEYPLPPDSTVVMHSDGLSSRWKSDRYPGLLRRDPALFAGVLYRDCARERDDSSVLVYRPPNSPALL